MATHPSILAWEIPWTEEPGGPRSMGSQSVGHDWVRTTTSQRDEKGKRCVWGGVSHVQSPKYNSTCTGQSECGCEVPSQWWHTGVALGAAWGPCPTLADQLSGSWDQSCIGRGGEGHRPALLPVSREMVGSPRVLFWSRSPPLFRSAPEGCWPPQSLGPAGSASRSQGYCPLPPEAQGACGPGCCPGQAGSCWARHRGAEQIQQGAGVHVEAEASLPGLQVIQVGVCGIQVVLELGPSRLSNADSRRGRGRDGWPQTSAGREPNCPGGLGWGTWWGDGGGAGRGRDCGEGTPPNPPSVKGVVNVAWVAGSGSSAG